MCPFAAAAALAIPDKGRRVFVPTSDRLLQPVNDFLGIFGMLAGESTRHNDALHGFCHVQPRSPNRRVERHHPMRHANQPTRSYDRCPARLSSTSTMRKGG